MSEYSRERAASGRTSLRWTARRSQLLKENLRDQKLELPADNESSANLVPQCAQPGRDMTRSLGSSAASHLAEGPSPWLGGNEEEDSSATRRR